MTHFQATTIVNDQRYIDAILFYRRRPIETDDKTFKLASMWINAANCLSKEVNE